MHSLKNTAFGIYVLLCGHSVDRIIYPHSDQENTNTCDILKKKHKVILGFILICSGVTTFNILLMGIDCPVNK